MSNTVKTLVFDIEVSPIISYTWGLFDQNIGLNQIKEDWFILAWSAKWLGDTPSKTFYMDNSKAKDIRNDKVIVEGLIELINQADVVITQNGEAFDTKKLNARAILNGLAPIKPCKSTDILKEGRKVFKFTSHKLEYISDKLNKKYKKLKHDEYPGFELWKAILSGDQRAWAVMKKYCIHDVLATEEAYINLRGWIKTQPEQIPLTGQVLCKCGSSSLEKRGYNHTQAGKYQMYRCLDCGKWPRSAVNLLTKEQREGSLRDGK